MSAGMLKPLCDLVSGVKCPSYHTLVGTNKVFLKLLGPFLVP